MNRREISRTSAATTGLLLLSPKTAFAMRRTRSTPWIAGMRQARNVRGNIVRKECWCEDRALADIFPRQTHDSQNALRRSEL